LQVFACACEQRREHGCEKKMIGGWLPQGAAQLIPTSHMSAVLQMQSMSC
jgi:hypothetical protein